MLLYQVIPGGRACCRPTMEERGTKRLEQEKLVLDALLAWVKSTSAKTAPKSALGNALHYLWLISNTSARA